MRFPQDLLNAIRKAKNVIVLTGAGVSAESGIPTFRDAQTGLWAQYDPVELATPEAFAKNPKLVWEWYTWRRELASRANPNPGHIALAKMENLWSQFLLITQNTDGLHQKAGSQKVLELHGNIQRTKCFREGRRVKSWNEDQIPPRCQQCGSYLRPDVVWFNESLPNDLLQQAFDSSSVADLFFSIGTSSIVQPAASLPLVALQNGAMGVEINPTQTPLTQTMTYSFQGPAGVVLPNLLEQAIHK